MAPGVELFDKSRGGDETRHKYLTHSEWHTDSKFVGLLKVGYQTSILEIKFKKMCLLTLLYILDRTAREHFIFKLAGPAQAAGVALATSS